MTVPLPQHSAYCPPKPSKIQDLKEKKNEFSNLSTDSRGQLALTRSSLSKRPSKIIAQHSYYALNHWAPWTHGVWERKRVCFGF